ncbi:MAG: hypothetical protein A4E25_00339 [Methanobacterium sp. PtaB.Bin024]|nr:MAG: hypothetical protein A4E25_00339 [Methanobacterium sp. PtaB.Bin024]
MCPNPNCPNQGGSFTDDFCEECGNQLVNMGFSQTGKIIDLKKRIKKGKIPEMTNEEIKTLYTDLNLEGKSKEEISEDEMENGIFRGLNPDKNNKNCKVTLNDDSLTIETERMHLLGGKGDENTIYYSNILGVTIKRHTLKKIIEIKTSAQTFKLFLFFPTRFVDCLNEKIQQSQNPKVVTSTGSSAGKLKEAKELLDIGAITEEEFNQIKEKHLANL